MPVDALVSSNALTSLTLTYLCHSTLVLATAWAALRLWRRPGAAVEEIGWKVAAIAALVSTPLVVFSSFSRAGWTFVLGGGDATSVASGKGNRLDGPPAGAGDARRQATGATSPTASSPAVVRTPRSSPTTSRPGSYAASISSKESSSVTGAATTTMTMGRRLGRVLSIAAGLVVLLGLVRMASVALSFGRSVRRLEERRCGPAREILDELVARAGVRWRVRLFSSPGPGSPAAFGVWRKGIVVPASVEAELDRDALEALLAHELAHLVRRDPLWQWIGRALCLCAPIQPLNILAWQRWRRAAELRCDDWALRHVASALPLARCLTWVAEQRRREFGYPGVSPALSMAGSASQLSHRVERLLRSHRCGKRGMVARQGRCLFGILTAALVTPLVLAAPAARFAAGDRVRTAREPGLEAYAPDSTPLGHVEVAQRTDGEGGGEALRLADALGQLERELDSLGAELDSLVAQLDSSPGERNDLRRRIESLARGAEAVGERHERLAAMSRRLQDRDSRQERNESTRHETASPSLRRPRRVAVDTTSKEER